jgi:hypothetical protein
VHSIWRSAASCDIHPRVEEAFAASRLTNRKGVSHEK